MLQVPGTRGVRILQVVQFFPKHSLIPQQAYTDLAIIAAQEVTASLKQGQVQQHPYVTKGCLKI